jgi:hypothetical protein
MHVGVETVEAVRAVQRDLRHAILQRIENALFGHQGLRRVIVFANRSPLVLGCLLCGLIGGLIMAQQISLTKTNSNEVWPCFDTAVKLPTQHERGDGRLP